MHETTNLVPTDAGTRRSFLAEQAVELFEGDAASAEKWLSEPNRALGWKSPNEILSSQSG